MAGIVTETKRRLLIGKEIKEVQVPTGTLDTSLYLSDLASVGATFNSGRIASELGALPAVVKQNASLALIADTYKTGAVYAINGDTKSLEELNFERGSSATYEDASGNIVLASANVPRINYRNGVLQGWLVEPASTNLLLDSGVANGLDSFYPKSTEGLTAGASGFNLGSLLANSVTLAKGSSTTYAYKSSSVEIVAGNVYTFSFFCRLSDGTAPTSNDMNVTFGGGSNFLSSWNSISYGNGVYRCYVTGVPVLSGSIFYFGVAKLNTSSDKTITVSGFQLEEGPYLTSYIPTTTAIATRLADKISTKRPTVVFNKNSMHVKTAEWPLTWLGNGVGNLNITGRNILKNSNSSDLFGIFSGSGATITHLGRVAVSEWNTTNASRVLVSGGTDVLKALLAIYTPKDGERVSVSGWFRNNHASNSITIFSNQGSRSITLAPQQQLRVDFSDIVGNGIGVVQFQIRTDITNDVDFTYWNLKCEKGTTSTPWQPAPEDYVKVDSNGNIEISYTEPIHIQQFSLISRELSQEEVS